jgi:predicted nucleic acid-binding Zn ribbon protein
MPIYDYYSEQTGEEKEVFHGMDENPEILDSEGNVMKRQFLLGHGGFKMVKDGTRRRDYKTRYGGKTKKSSHTPNAQESAELKAQKQREDKLAKKKDPADPYAGFRD